MHRCILAIPGLISCTGVTGSVGITPHVHGNCSPLQMPLMWNLIPTRTTFFCAFLASFPFSLASSTLLYCFPSPSHSYLSFSFHHFLPLLLLPFLLSLRKYASSFSTHGSYSYVYTHKTPFGNYSFIAMDACPHPGPRRPFNFFGVLHDVCVCASLCGCE